MMMMMFLGDICIRLPLAAILAAMVILFAVPAECGSCREAKLCCPGRDSSCVVQKAPINAIIEDLSDKPCYCDHACLKLGDCCDDFKDACGVVDCEVSPWGPWTVCDADCGPGTMSRTRTIQVQPQNGGRHCPSLQQRRGCQMSNCHNHQDHAIKEKAGNNISWEACSDMHKVREAASVECNNGTDIREIAILLPGALSHTRKMNITNDIRRNLRLSNPEEHPEYDPEREYCVEFEVLKASKACRKEQVFNALKEGERICVKCESEALRKNLDWRCQGHGVAGRVTRWSAFSAPHCHGKWLRAQPEPSKECPAKNCPSNSTFIFV